MPSSSSSTSSPHVQVTCFVLLAILLCCYFLQLQVAEASTPTPSVDVGNISRVEDSEYFHIYYGRTFKVIKNGVDGKSYLLMQNNSRMASRTKYCTGRIKSFVIPLSNYSSQAKDFPVSFFELLGILDGLKGITSDAVASQCTLKSLSSGDIAVVNSSDTKQFSAHFVGSADDAYACNAVSFAPLEEVSPLKRAEWIKFMGVFANAEERANSVYNAVKSNYICLSKMAANKSSRFKPVVAWIVYNQGMWSFAKEDIMKQYVTDAGGESVDDSITRNSYNALNPEDIDDFYAILCTIDVVIDQTYASNPEEYTLSTFLNNINLADKDNSFGFLANQSLWRYDKRAHNAEAFDWFDGGISQPQLVLADLIEAIFPTGSYTTTYLRNVVKGENITKIEPEMCDRSSAMALEPTIIPCQ